MNKVIIFLLLLVSSNCFGQDLNLMLKQASNYERFLKEDSALLKYKEVLVAQPEQSSSLIKSSLLTASIGARQLDKIAKKNAFETAKTFAEQAWQ